MITANTRFSLVSGSQVLFAALDMECVPTLIPSDDLVGIDIRVLATAGTSVTVTGGSHRIEVPVADLLGYTSTGSDEVEKFLNLCEQAVVDYLEGLAENSAVTFTIS